MEIAYTLSEDFDTSPPYVLTIGSFDGIHLGHEAILRRLKEVAKKKKAHTAVLSFINHPSTVLLFKQPVPLICSLSHKIHLLQNEGIDLLILLPFTQAFSEQPIDVFMHQLKKHLRFTSLILGYDATLGNKKQGDRKTVEQLGHVLEFDVEYLPEIVQENQRISSSKIRELITQGKLEKAENFLGRPFSVYGIVAKGAGKGSKIGFPTANIAVEEVCLPPLGVYAVRLKQGGRTLYGVANLGIAPTLRSNQIPLFEIHVFDHSADLYGQPLEAIFTHYIRPEKQFENIEDLKQQIQHDIEIAKKIHGRSGI